MSDYTKLTNYAVKDGYPTGTPAKVIKGTELDDEFNAISTAIATKVDSTDVITVSTGGTGATTAADARLNLSAAKSGANSDITSLTGLTTALGVAQGGTGAASLAANAVVLGNGTGAVQTVAPGASGNILVSNGTTWTSSPFSIATGAGAVSNGGTFTVTLGSSGSALIQVQGYFVATFGNFGTGTIAISIGGNTVASQSGRTMEYDSRTSGANPVILYRHTGTANSTVTVTFSYSGPGSFQNATYSFIGT